MHSADLKTALRLSMQYESYFESGGDNGDIALVSPEQFESKLITALCMCEVDPVEGHRRLLVLASYKNTIKFRLLALKANVYYTCLFIRSPFKSDWAKAHDLVYEMDEIKRCSVSEVYPEIQVLISRHFSAEVDFLS
jgi:hypothetical protein